MRQTSIIAFTVTWELVCDSKQFSTSKKNRQVHRNTAKKHINVTTQACLQFVKKTD